MSCAQRRERTQHAGEVFKPNAVLDLEPTQYDMIDTNRTAVLALLELEHASESSVPSTPPHENIVNALRPSCVPSAPETELIWRAWAKRPSTSSKYRASLMPHARGTSTTRR
jgi:hypothetical protein